MLLKRYFGSLFIGINLNTRTDVRFFNLARLITKRKLKNITLSDLLFADDAALVTHYAEDLLKLLSQFLVNIELQACLMSPKKDETVRRLSRMLFLLVVW